MKQRTVLLSGGGTAGHITPTLHVAKELRRLHPELRLTYVIEKGSRFKELVNASGVIDTVHPVTAGKWRRYHGVSLIDKLLDITTNVRNLIDVVKVAVGTIAMCLYFIRNRPDVVFAKGGFVVVPVGIAARLFRVPIITHDSDSLPGLANRIISKWAIVRSVASESTAEAYNNERTKVVGIPIDEEFRPVSNDEQKVIKAKLGAGESTPTVLIIGGSLGSQRLNEAMKEAITRIVAEMTGVHILWVVGRANYHLMVEWRNQQPGELVSSVDIRDFITDMPHWLVASDVVISRGGATALAEIVAAQKPAIIVPAGFLPGGHQVDNAEYLQKKHAIEVVIEQEDVSQYASELAVKTVRLLTDEVAKNRLIEGLSHLPKRNASKELAEIIFGAMK